MQERMSVALPSDEHSQDGSTTTDGQLYDSAMEHGYGAPTGVPPSQKTHPPPPVWKRTEEGRRQMESLGEILAERVIGQVRNHVTL